MADIGNGGSNIPGNLAVFGNADVNGDINVDGGAVIDGTLNSGAITATTAGLTSLTTTAGISAATSVSLGTHLLLKPTADAPTPPSEGMVYADTDHKLYF